MNPGFSSKETTRDGELGSFPHSPLGASKSCSPRAFWGCFVLEGVFFFFGGGGRDFTNPQLSIAKREVPPANRSLRKVYGGERLAAHRVGT